ncbi:HAD family hydrolase [Candidatus Dojkabacteria bacterium]|uniref:HAD family hydrolase n=1 Tax=Candidatus Dojkabacteria bacterium TaxID=2099670 RepID=A0A3M0YYK4_9BACT|nr:MAG: HAD family hydrolase [Candidatus Dojkabacteria bacterium]
MKAVIFDLDNTLCDTLSSIPRSMKVCYKYLKNFFPDLDLDKFLKIEEEIFVRLTIEQRLPVYSFRALYWHEIFQELGLEADPILIKNVIHLYGDQMAKTVELFPGIEDLLTELKKRGLKLAILSNGDFFTKASMVEYLNIGKYFDLVVASDITQVDKPDPRAFLYVLQKLDVKAYECLFVGDERQNDIMGAQNVGLIPVYVTWPEKNLNKVVEGAYNVSTPLQILDLVEQNLTIAN